jgi:hypothetical protein
MRRGWPQTRKVEMKCKKIQCLEEAERVMVFRSKWVGGPRPTRVSLAAFVPLSTAGCIRIDAASGDEEMDDMSLDFGLFYRLESFMQ